MLKKTLLLSGILSSILLISTIIFAKEESSSLFEDFNFPTGTIAKNLSLNHLMIYLIFLEATASLQNHKKKTHGTDSKENT